MNSLPLHAQTTVDSLAKALDALTTARNLLHNTQAAAYRAADAANLTLNSLPKSQLPTNKYAYQTYWHYRDLIILLCHTKHDANHATHKLRLALTHAYDANSLASLIYPQPS